MADARALAQLVREKFEEKQTMLNVKIDRFDSGGSNYTSALFKILVSRSGHDDLHLFAKIASFSQSMRSRVNADWIYTNEQFVYTKLVKIYDELQQSHGVPHEHRFDFPKCFAHSTEHGHEAIVTEDLAVQGYTSFDRLTSMDWEFASKSVETLAKFHALSLVFAHEQPEEFEKIAVSMKYGIGLTDENAQEVYVKMVENSLSALEEEYKDRVRKKIFSEEMTKYYNKPVKKLVLVHGDYRLSNLMFKKEDDVLHVRVVDYQMMHSGCALSDLVYFIALGSDKQFRAKYFRKLIGHYRLHLQLSVSRFGLDLEEVYPKKIFDLELHTILPQVVMFGITVLPAVVADEENAPKAGDNFDVFETRKSKPSKIFTERINELIEDCVDWGVV